MNTQELEVKLKSYINTQIANLSKTNPSLAFMRPLITRVLDNKVKQMHSYFDLLADESGNIDVSGILSEMINNVTSAQPFTANIPFLGDVVVGGGTVKIGMPLINKDIVLNSADLISFKNYMLGK